MKIKELIEELQQYDENLEVSLVGGSCDHGTIVKIIHHGKGHPIDNGYLALEAEY